MREADRLFDQAAARLFGHDLRGARELFGRAGAAGRLDAAVIHCNLVASGEDWQRGLALLRGLARVNRRSRRELDVIEAMALTPTGDPVSVPAGEQLGERPHLTLFRGLFSEAECRYLIGAAEPMLEPSVVVDRRTGRQVRDPVRTSDGVGFTWPLENPAVHSLNRRIAAASGTTVEQGEPLQVLRYRPGEEYKPHFDAIPGFANQRALTMLVWLNDDYEGGETLFMTPGRKLKGGVGDALLFRNTDSSGRRDDAAGHAGLPVTRGEKLIASRWIRQRKFEPPPASEGRAG
ncbi:MAG TPA: 2OG-Fe(II) oxygenase [Allosphingosinicella sp.]|nr:2OG-Fe(II) oxygenase [Allosphingosinicella sp.]